MNIEKAAFYSDPAAVQVIRGRTNTFKVFHYPIVFFSAEFCRVITVPVGYVTDLASIPKPLKAIIDVNGPHREAAIVHDYLCTDGAKLGISQKEADLIFREAMIVLGVPRHRVWSMFNGVRIFQVSKRWVKRQKYGGVYA